MIMTHKVIVNCFHVNRKGHLHRLHTFSLLITGSSTQLIDDVCCGYAGCRLHEFELKPRPHCQYCTKIQGNVLWIIIYHSTIWAMNYKSHVPLAHNVLWPGWSTQLMQISLKGLLYTHPAVYRRAAGHQHQVMLWGQCAVDMKPSKTSENVCKLIFYI